MRQAFIWIFLYYLRFFAKLALVIHKPKIIGITGSVGKSSTRNSLHALMKDYFKVKVIKEGNSETGIPLGILGISPGHYRLPDWLRAMVLAPVKINNLRETEYLIVEMGIDSPYPPKNMDYLLTIVRPDISVVINVHPVHTMQFDELFKGERNQKKRMDLIVKRITAEKMKIITKVKPDTAIYNGDSFYIKNQISKIKNTYQKSKIVSFGKSEEADIKYLDYQVSLDGTKFVFSDDFGPASPKLQRGEQARMTLNIKNLVLPRGYLEVFAATIAVGRSLKLSLNQITESLEENFTLPAGRGSIFEGINSSIIIDSSYNASKASVLTYLELAEELSEKENRPLVLLLGDMRELGEETEHEHKAITKKIDQLDIDQVYCVGSNTKKYVKNSQWFKTSIEAGEFLRKALPYRVIILVKGSQNEIFLEEAVKKLLKNKSDMKKLCRQNDFWLRKKKSFWRMSEQSVSE